MSVVPSDADTNADADAGGETTEVTMSAEESVTRRARRVAPGTVRTEDQQTMSHPTLVQVWVGVERLPGAPYVFFDRARVAAQTRAIHRDIHVNTATLMPHTRAPDARARPQRWRAGGADGVLVACWWCADGVLVACWWCAGGVLVSARIRGSAPPLPKIKQSTIAHPVDAVFEAYRDQLGEVAAYLDDIREIKVLSREEDGDVTRLHNEWASSTEIPAVAAKFLKPEHLLWDDYASWDAGARSCAWEIKTRAFTEAVSCRGGTRLVADGEVTRVILEGDLTVDTTAIKGIPRFLAGRITPQIEKFIVGLVTPNLEKTNAAIGRFLDDRRG